MREYILSSKGNIFLNKETLEEFPLKYKINKPPTPTKVNSPLIKTMN